MLADLNLNDLRLLLLMLMLQKDLKERRGKEGGKQEEERRSRIITDPATAVTRVLNLQQQNVPPLQVREGDTYLLHRRWRHVRG